MSLVGFDWLALGPAIIVGVAGVVLLLGDAFAGVRSWTMGTAVSLVALVGAAVAAGGLSGGHRETMCTQLTGQEALDRGAHRCRRGVLGTPGERRTSAVTDARGDRERAGMS